MSFFQNTFFLKRIAILISIIIVSMVLWNTYSFFKLFKFEERLKMEILANAQKELVTNTDLNASTTLPLAIIENNKNIPLILVDENDQILLDRNGNVDPQSYQNLDSVKALDIKYLEKQLKIMKSQNEPIEIKLLDNKVQKIYYRNSDLLGKLTYYPLALILILTLFLAVIYMMFTSNKIAEQNKLWTGMAKETAHQIGTPLSSLLGWIAILKTENVNDKYVDEIENDVHRLNTIANRFSKIGSLPELAKQNVVLLTKGAYDYLESRSSKQIQFSFSSSEDEIFVNLNKELFGWVIENLIKNAIDAMQGKGSVSISIESTTKKVKILVTDTGKGIPKSQFKQIFKPGFTTKKRGWGLGLSLSKRIIEDYHKGKIFVKKSELGKGTSFVILLNRF
ncbi:HAMP domain-containing sensor histidine kinase [Pseudotenacibaculum sp. MALMAid0570]|uniref:sensor histidine kinase n=1 Tax=Pseudotenacibaculum sp. MALMAid0570 TaxID=3143938 RepID=UPI0032DF60DF